MLLLFKGVEIKMYRTAIIEPQVVFSEAIKGVLTQNELFNIVAVEEHSYHINTLVKRCKPDLIITELDRRNPFFLRDLESAILLNPQIKFVILTSDYEIDYFKHVLTMGVHGVLHKSMDSREIMTSIQDVLHDGMYLYSQAASYVVDELKRLNKVCGNNIFQVDLVKPLHL